nr:hypothetical protein [Angustibacter aerolatus]
MTAGRRPGSSPGAASRAGARPGATARTGTRPGAAASGARVRAAVGPRPTRLRRIAVLGGVFVVLAVLLAPALRSYLAQQHDIAEPARAGRGAARGRRAGSSGSGRPGTTTPTSRRRRVNG